MPDRQCTCDKALYIGHTLQEDCPFGVLPHDPWDDDLPRSGLQPYYGRRPRGRCPDCWRIIAFTPVGHSRRYYAHVNPATGTNCKIRGIA